MRHDIRSDTRRCVHNFLKKKKKKKIEGFFSKYDAPFVKKKKEREKKRMKLSMTFQRVVYSINLSE